jgi:hypothetical protein
MRRYNMPEMTALEDATRQGVTKQVKPTFGYYRQPNGWITVSPATDLEELSYRREGWEPLNQYGRIEMGTEYMADHPLEPLFMRGGVKELCVEQIIGMGLHLDPPVVPTCGRSLDQYHRHHMAVCWNGAKPVSFPQLDGMETESFQCRFCERSPFPTEKARDQHEGVMHKEEKSDIRTGETLADSLVKGLSGTVGPTRPAGSGLPYVCGYCGDGFTNHIRLSRHVKSEHKEATDGEGNVASEE